jgi:hypothetical protein
MGSKQRVQGHQDAPANLVYLSFAIVDSNRIALQKLLLDKSATKRQAGWDSCVVVCRSAMQGESVAPLHIRLHRPPCR